MAVDSANDEAYKKLHTLIKDIEYAMLTSVDGEGRLRSRPMVTQQSEVSGKLWFFTAASSTKVDEIRNDQEVNVAYVGSSASTFVSVSGRARPVRDEKKKHELWNPAMKAWFPKGVDDPNLILLEVSIEAAEYWDVGSNKVAQLIGLAKALATGKAYAGEGADHKKL